MLVSFPKRTIWKCWVRSHSSRFFITIHIYSWLFNHMCHNLFWLWLKQHTDYNFKLSNKAVWHKRNFDESLDFFGVKRLDFKLIIQGQIQKFFFGWGTKFENQFAPILWNLWLVNSLNFHFFDRFVFHFRLCFFFLIG